MDYLSHETIDDVLVVRFLDATVVDSEVVESLTDSLSWRMSESDCTKVILDFTNVQLATSEIIGGLVAFKLYCEVRGASLKLSGITDEFRHVLKLTKLDTQFKSYRTITSALEMFGAEDFVIRHRFFADYAQPVEAEPTFFELIAPAGREAAREMPRLSFS